MLIFSPTYEGKEYCRKRFIDNVKKINYPNYEFIMVDNSVSPRYYKKLKLKNIPIYRVPRGNNSREALAAAQNFARKYAIDNGFDYVLSLESDLFPPADIIQRLLKHWQPIVGALYYLGGYIDPVRGVKKPIVPCVFMTKEDGSGGTRFVTREEHQLFTESGGLKKVHGMGVGCTLIDIELLKNYYFWCDNRFENKHSDVYFYMKLWNDKVPVYVDYDTVVEHKPSAWSIVKDR